LFYKHALNSDKLAETVAATYELIEHII